MDSSPKKHAWMFQFRVNPGSDWLDLLRRNRHTRWKIIRWARETCVGDLLFFWQSGEAGGLWGWGYVDGDPYPEKNSSPKTWSVPVRVEEFLDKPISRVEVLNAGAFRPRNLYLRMPQPANFRIEPDEARRFFSLMGSIHSDSAALNDLVAHAVADESDARGGIAEGRLDEAGEAGTAANAGVAADEMGERVYSMKGLFEDKDFSPLARDLIQLATFHKYGIRGPVSSTRIFLAAFALAEQVTIGQKTSYTNEEIALRALKGVGSEYEANLRVLRKEYLEEQKKGRAQEIIITDSVKSILDDAKRNAFLGHEHLPIGIDALISAVLRQERGRLWRRMARVGLTRSEMARAILSVVAQLHPEASFLWLRPLGQQDDQPPTEVDRLRIPFLGNDNAWQEGQKDALGADREAQAFAGLALSRDFKPPLAIGIFGEWGSGKSFFMRLVHDHVARLSAQAKAQGDSAPLLGKVVQIRFNAWHYVETNLWASLVDHIFSELDRATGAKLRSNSEKLFDQLATARELTLESAETLVTRRREQESAALAVAESQRRLKEAQTRAASSPKVYWDAVRDQFIEGIENEPALAKAARDLGINQVVEDIRPLADAIRELDRERTKAAYLGRAILNQLGSYPKVLLFLVLALTVPSLLWVIRSGIEDFFEFADLSQVVSNSMLAISGFFAACAVTVKAAIDRARSAISVIQSFREKLDAATARVLESPSSDLKKQQDDLVRLSAEVNESKSRLSTATEKLSLASGEYNAGTSRARLLKFVRARAADQSYARHLGLVATIRKDFEELSDLIAAAGLNELPRSGDLGLRTDDNASYQDRVEALISFASEEGTNLLHGEEVEKLRRTAETNSLDSSETLDRIVLYIDDLDRCQPDKVAEVLQAVHLLLSFKLFVVFVAVDIRWVGKALEEHYPMLAQTDSPGGSARAQDYLEKIFQVPYWVRPMTEEAGESFIRGRLPISVASVRVDLPRLGSVVSTHPMSNPPMGSINESESASEAEISELHKLSIENTQLHITEDFEVVGGLSDRIELSEGEQELIVLLGRCAGASPRRLVRFMNVYQVVKASLPFGTNQEQLYAVMIQIAVLTGAPDLLDRWSAFLSECSDSDTVGMLSSEIGGSGWAEHPAQAARLKSALATFERHAPRATAVDLRRYIDLARRFSFMGGRGSDRNLPI